MEVIRRKNVKVKSDLEYDFTFFCNKLSEALYLKGLQKSRYIVLIPEILYYLVKVIVGIVSFVNSFEPLLTLFSSINSLSKDERVQFIDKVKAQATKKEMR